MPSDYHDVLDLANAYYAMPGNSSGGNLHIVLDDHNIENEHIAYCLVVAHDAGDREGEALALAMLKLSKTQRLKVCNNIGKVS